MPLKHCIYLFLRTIIVKPVRLVIPTSISYVMQYTASVMDLFKLYQ